MIIILRITRWIFELAFSLLSHRDVSGVENIPSDPPYIVVANHLSYFDAPLVFTILKVKLITGWAAEKYQRHPLFGPFVSLHGGVFIQRGKVDRKALNTAMDRLQNGYVFGIAPEGTRSNTGTLARGKTGAAYLHRQHRQSTARLTAPAASASQHTRRRAFPLAAGARGNPQRRPAPQHRRNHVPHRCLTAAFLSRRVCRSSSIKGIPRRSHFVNAANRIAISSSQNTQQS